MIFGRKDGEERSERGNLYFLCMVNAQTLNVLLVSAFLSLFGFFFLFWWVFLWQVQVQVFFNVGTLIIGNDRMPTTYVPGIYLSTWRSAPKNLSLLPKDPLWWVHTRGFFSMDARRMALVAFFFMLLDHFFDSYVSKRPWRIANFFFAPIAWRQNPWHMQDTTSSHYFLFNRHSLFNHSIHYNICTHWETPYPRTKEAECGKRMPKISKA